MKLRTVAVVGAMAFVPAITPALASESAHPAVGDISVFATVPAPGHPFGVAVTRTGSTSRPVPATSLLRHLQAGISIRTASGSSLTT